MNFAPRYAEFFCGGGMVRAALNDRWNCVFANDIDPMKCSVYAGNWGKDALVEGDVRDVRDGLLRQPIDMYWASSPCQDFSLAGKGLGLAGERGGAFHAWMAKITPALEAGFAPKIIAFENVVGLIARNKGSEFEHVLKCFIRAGYKVGALEIDAKEFLPQSRPRLFVVAVRRDIDIQDQSCEVPSSVFHSKRLRLFTEQAPKLIKDNWIWWKVYPKAKEALSLMRIIDHQPDTPWFTPGQVEKLISMMSAPSLQRLDQIQGKGGLAVGTLYKRGRPDDTGAIRQRAEIRFDGLAGCLRTPAGGSSRQTLVFVEGQKIQARLLSSREVARLMGLDDSFKMPDSYNKAYKVAGDGVAVPVVRHLDMSLFKPLLQNELRNARVA